LGEEGEDGVEVLTEGDLEDDGNDWEFESAVGAILGEGGSMNNKTLLRFCHFEEITSFFLPFS
jgi:hypothetical protein